MRIKIFGNKYSFFLQHHENVAHDTLIDVKA